MPTDALIAIVDDDDSFRNAMEGLMRSLGLRAIGYPSAERFLESVDGLTAQCIVSDIQMPGMSGIEMKRKLNESGVDIALIFVTARSEPALHEQAMATGAICLLQKPFEAQLLVDWLERALCR